MVIPEGLEVGVRRRSPAPLVLVAVVLALAAVLWRLGSDHTGLDVVPGSLPAAGEGRAEAVTPGLEGLPQSASLAWQVAARLDPPEVVVGDLVTVTAVAPAGAESVAVRLPGETAFRPMERAGDSWNGDFGLWRLRFRVGDLPAGIGHVLVRATVSGQTKEADVLLTVK